MKSIRIQSEDIKKDFRDACFALTNRSAFKNGRDYRMALDKRTMAINKLFQEGIITPQLYQELMMSDDFTNIPESLQ